MDNKKLGIPIVAVLIFLSFTINGQSSVQKMDDETWKADAFLALAERYVSYKKSYNLVNNWGYATDLYSKFHDLNRFPFGAGMHKLKEDLTSKKIVFDSIVCEIEQTVSHSNFELLLPAAYYIFKDGKIIKLLLFEPEDVTFSEVDWEQEVKEEMYSKSIKMKDNAFLSLLVFTKIYPNWKFEINKIVINSHY